MTSPSFTNNMVKVLFNTRSSMTRNIKENILSMYKDNMRCQLICRETSAIDSQPHLLQCQVLLDNLNPEEVERIKGVTYIIGTYLGAWSSRGRWWWCSTGCWRSGRRNWKGRAYRWEDAPDLSH